MIANNSNQFSGNMGSADIWAETQPMPYADRYDVYLANLYTIINTKLLIQHNRHIMQTVTTAANETVTLNHLINQRDHFIVFAEDGIGKADALLSWVREAILQRLDDMNRPLPIYAHVQFWDALKPLPLAYWLSTQTSLDADTVEALIEDGQVVLFLDGLDDLTQKQHRNLDARQTFLDMLPTTCTVILSSRYQENAKDAINTPHTLTVHPLHDEQIQSYLEQWTQTKQLWQTVRLQPHLLDSLRQPIVLTLFAEAFRGRAWTSQCDKQNRGDFKDIIFEHYIERQYQALIQPHPAPFSLEQVYTILGLVATRGVIRYGTGRVAMIEIKQDHWDDLLIVDDLRFGFMGGHSGHGDKFLAFVQQLKLITHPQDGMSSTFTHPIIRDLFVLKHCLPIEEKLDSYTIESLTRISDPRKYDAFATILSGDFMLNYKLQAFAALETDSSEQALRTLLILAETLNHDFFSERIKESIDRRMNHHQ